MQRYILISDYAILHSILTKIIMEIGQNESQNANSDANSDANQIKFVPLHRRMCLTLVKIANFNSGSVRRRRLQFIPVDCTSVHIDGCLAIPNEV